MPPRHATPCRNIIFRGCLCALSALRCAGQPRPAGAGLSSTSTLHCNRKRKSRSACIALVRAVAWCSTSTTEEVGRGGIARDPSCKHSRARPRRLSSCMAGPGHLDVLAFTLAVLLQWAHFRNTLFFFCSNKTSFLDGPWIFTHGMSSARHVFRSSLVLDRHVFVWGILQSAGRARRCGAASRSTTGCMRYSA